MKVIAISGSARMDGNTATLIRQVFKPLEAAGIATEMIQLAGQAIGGCTACMQCWENQDRRCAEDSDVLNALISMILEADGIILGSPVYFANVSSEIKALIDRVGMVAKANGDMLRRKVGAAVVAARRAGAVHTFDSINHFFFISQMIVPGASYWNLGIGQDKGDVAADAEGLKTMTDLGENIAWLLSRLG